MQPDHITFGTEYLKAWRARLGLGEHGMAAYVGVPLFTWRKWENGTRTPDAAPMRLLALLQRLETDAPAIHAEMLQDAQKQPQDAPKRRGKGATGAEKRASGPESEPVDPLPMVYERDFAANVVRALEKAAAPAPWVAAADALPDWMKSDAPPA